MVAFTGGGAGEPGEAAEGNEAAGKVHLSRTRQKKRAKINPLSSFSSCPRISQRGEGRAAGRAAGRLAGPGQPLGRAWPAARPAPFLEVAGRFFGVAGRPAGRLAGHSATRPAAVRPWPRPPAAEHGRRSYTSAATTQFAHLNRGLAGRPAAWPAPRPPWPATRPSAGHIRAGPNLSLAGPNLSLAGRLAGRAAGPILGVASPDFPSGRPGGRPDLAAGRPVRQGGRPLTT